ncbi:hypothetical protein [Sphaerimonospora thailandensis]|uniref:HprK-related kinase B n=1 Tax=Sphaerimonospora thailandensis TaxID=795644 RepID=A0A8J3W0C5_9ACTN|nr:hypothetical protein [Sphaerimonospora thailandensis]GIH71015.1 hypothetical protein Mth01_32680 [Sphaerimonospora thailandensis]
MTTDLNLTCHMGDVTITVTASPADLDRLACHFADYLPASIAGLDLPGIRLNVHTDRDRFRSAAATFALRATATVEPVPGVILTEGRTAAGARCYTVAGDALEGRPGAWAASIDGAVIDLYVADPHCAPRYALRLIREAMLRTYEDAGGIVFHAAGLDVSGRAVMICAPQGAGKTSTLAALLHILGQHAALLSNDRLILHGERRVLAVPLPVPVARGTLDAYPALRPLYSRTPADLPEEFGTRHKVALPARPFAAAFGSALTAASKLGAIIVPAFTDTAQPVNIGRLNTEETRELLNAVCFTPVDEFWRPWLIRRSRSDADLAAAAASVCARLANTPCYRVEYGVRGPVGHLQRALTNLIGDLL